MESNIGFKNCVDLNKEFQKGSYFVIGTSNNKWCDENDVKQLLKFCDFAADDLGVHARD